MATITLTIPADKVDRVVHALCAAAALPETSANAKQAIINWIKVTTANVERSEAEAARPAVAEPDVAGLAT